MKTKSLYLLILMFTVISSCKTIRYKSKNTQEKEYYEKIMQNQFQFDQFKSKIYGTAEYNNKQYDFLGTITILHDSIINIKIINPLGIPLFKILLTKNSLAFSSIYSSNNFTYDSLFIKTGLKLNFECIENLLTDNFCRYRDLSNYTAQIDDHDSIIVLELKRNAATNKFSLYKEIIEFNKNKKKISQFYILDNTISNSELFVKYKDYQKSNNISEYFPKTMEIKFINNDTFSIFINYKSIKIR